MSKLFTFNPKVLKTKFTYFVKFKKDDDNTNSSGYVFNEETLFENHNQLNAKYRLHNQHTTQDIINLLGVDDTSVGNLKESAVTLVNALIREIDENGELVYLPRKELIIADERESISFIPENDVVKEGDMLIFADDSYLVKKEDDLFELSLYLITIKLTADTRMIIKPL